MADKKWCVWENGEIVRHVTSQERAKEIREETVSKITHPRVWNEEDFVTKAYVSKEPNIINKEFLKENANVSINIEQSGVFIQRSLLLWAAIRGHLEILRFLIENDVDYVNTYEYQIFDAATEGDLEIIKYLLSLNVYTEELVHSVASHSKSDEIRELMMNYKQFPNTKACKK